MDKKQTPQWLKDYQQPVLKRKNVDCHSNHRHITNIPAAGFVLVRLNAASKLELLLDLRSLAVIQGNTYGFIGGNASSMGESPLTTALREAKEEYHIEPQDLNILNIQWTRDHGGYKYLNYTYVFAEYNPKDGQAPSPRTFESQRSEWFPLDALPSNLMSFIREDRQMLEHILYNGIWPMLLARPNQATPANVNANCNMNSLSGGIDGEGDIAMVDSPPPPPQTPPNMYNIPKVPSPEGQLPLQTQVPTAGMPAADEVKYPELPSINIPPSSISSGIDGEYIPLALDNPAGEAVSKKVYEMLYTDKDITAMKPSSSTKMGTEVNTDAKDGMNVPSAVVKQTEKSANKETFAEYALKMLNRSKEESKEEEPAKPSKDNRYSNYRLEVLTDAEAKELAAKKAMSDKAQPMPKPAPEATTKTAEKTTSEPTTKPAPKDTMKLAASEKEDQPAKSPGLISRFSNLFRSSSGKADEKPAEAAKPAEKMGATPAAKDNGAGATNTDKPTMTRLPIPLDSDLTPRGPIFMMAPPTVSRG
ncbi:hypothetical protein RRF57_003431 [Xylaria bambusicola]|uniref:Nudix hydrolase domain-containing protein n=1 Tax=Xylaria bambusicola TaxID=326684 RepID=A0AAN7ULT2_9PEZI